MRPQNKQSYKNIDNDDDDGLETYVKKLIINFA